MTTRSTGHRDQGQWFQVLQHPPRNRDQGCSERKEQSCPNSVVPQLEGEQGQLRDEELQQAGPPRLLHHL